MLAVSAAEAMAEAVTVTAVTNTSAKALTKVGPYFSGPFFVTPERSAQF